MYSLILNDGTSLACRFCAARSGTLTLGIESELTFIQVSEMFADASKTALIAFAYGEMRDEHEGYTKLILVNGTTPNEYIISLKKEAD